MNNFLDEVSEQAEIFIQETKKRANDSLDFSIESLVFLDKMLAEAHHRVGDMTEESLTSVSFKAGCYVLEVARRNFGGSYFWSEHYKQPFLITGQPAFEIALLAIEKVKGRIVKGNENNIPFFFDGFVKAIAKGKETGYRAMIC